MTAADRTSARRRPGTVRAFLSLGIVMGLGSVATMASWSTEAMFEPGSLAAGTLDVVVDGQLAGTSNIDGTYVIEPPTSNLLPGESRSFSFTVSNAGQAPVDVTLDAAAEGVAAAALRWSFNIGGTAAAGGDDPGPLDAPTGFAATATCEGGTDVADLVDLTLDATPVRVDPATSVRTLEPTGPDASVTYCVVVSVDDSQATIETQDFRQPIGAADSAVGAVLTVIGTQVGVRE